MRLALLTLALSIASFACTASSRQSTEPPSVGRRVALILGGSEFTECKTAADCDSGLCAARQCLSLAQVRETWMEGQVARALKGILAEHPGAIDDVVARVEELLDSDEPYLMGHVAGMLGQLGEARFVPRLTRLLSDASEVVRTRAALALLRLGDPVAVADADGLLTHRSESVALDALEAVVAAAGAGFSARVLVRALEAERPRLRERAVALVRAGRIDSAELRAALQAILERPSEGHLHHDVRRTLEAIGAPLSSR